ncbi:MAG TPA: alcohol dehydrogenase catalytic domain-containing protein [Paenibacillus sp.]|nr:alcohol dehydrogenase catalytic domain-containing protein [Paenibacillus sp.]
MKAAVIEAIDQLVVKKVAFPEIRPGHVLVKVSFGGLCGPTDDAILRGLHPRAAFPLVLCHEFSGIVFETGASVNKVKSGDPVVVNPLLVCGDCSMCREGHSYICENLRLIGIDQDGGFAEYCLVPEDAAVPVPESMPLKVAALSEPMAVGVHAVKESGLGVGQRALVFGAGPIGMLTAEACRIAGADAVTMVDLDARRLDMARSMGFAAVRDLAELSGEPRFEFVFETTGAAAVLSPALEMVKTKGTVMIVGKFDSDPPFDLHTVLFKEIVVKGARVYRSREFLTAVRLLASNPNRYERLITDVFDLEHAPDVIESFRTKRNVGKLMIAM